MALNPIIARHKKLLTTIKDELDPNSEEHDSFIEHFKGYVPRGILSAKKNLLGKFDALATKGHLRPGKYDVLKKICEDSGNIDLLTLIVDAEKDIEELNKTETANRSTSAGPSGSNVSGRNTANRSTSAGPSGSNVSVRNTNEPERKRARKGELDTSDELHKDGYYVNTGKKGLLLILNFTENRTGTEHDVDKLKAFFGPGGLNFEMLDPRDDELRDLTKSQVDEALKDAQHKLNRNNYKRYYCFVCVILSHGNEIGIRTRGNIVKPIDEIQKSFNNKNIPNFAGRPRLFFIQACRGTANQLGQHVDDADDEVTTNAAENNKIDEADELIYIPTDADILTAYATTLGYKSFRRQGIGSWFITECINVFREYHKEDHVEDMLITVREKVALRWQKDDGAKQMPCVNSTLTHRLMFTKSE